MNSTQPHDCETDRRGLLVKGLAVAMGAAACFVPAMTALAAFLNPWRQKQQSTQTGPWVRVASLDALPAGPPQGFPVTSDRWDAWNHFPPQSIGTVFLRKTGDKQVAAFTAACPHAGGYVLFDQGQNRFVCPYHGALFDVDGKRLNDACMSPRDMDALDVEIRNDSEVWVKFEAFHSGRPEKIVKT